MNGSPPLTAPRRVRAVLNAEGGTVRAGGVSATDVAGAFARHGIEAEVRFVPGASITAEAQAALADAIAGAKHVVFERSGHFAHVEEPAAFVRMLDENRIRKAYVPSFKMWNYRKRTPLLSIEVSEILWISSASNYVELHLGDLYLLAADIDAEHTVKLFSHRSLSLRPSRGWPILLPPDGECQPAPTDPRAATV